MEVGRCGMPSVPPEVAGYLCVTEATPKERSQWWDKTLFRESNKRILGNVENNKMFLVWSHCAVESFMSDNKYNNQVKLILFISLPWW